MTAAAESNGNPEASMLGAVPGAPATGRGPVEQESYARHEYHHPAAGWGAAKSVGEILEHAPEPVEGVRAIVVMNHEDGGFDCPGCAWPDDPTGLRLDICENGVKHVTWEMTPATADGDFFASHTVTEIVRLDRPRSRSGRPAGAATDL